MRKAMVMTIMMIVMLCSGCGKDKDVYTPSGEPKYEENGVSVYEEEDFTLYKFESQDVLNK